ncbi:hypothetical protein ACO0SA_004609 [Hanseniaspora valbyensis]
MSRNKKKTYNHAKMMANKKSNKQKQEANKKKKAAKKKVSFNYNRQFNELIDLNDDNLAFDNNQQDIYNYYNSKKNDNKFKRRGLFIHNEDIESKDEVEDESENMNIPLRKRRVVFVKSQYNLNEEPKDLFKEDKKPTVEKKEPVKEIIIEDDDVINDLDNIEIEDIIEDSEDYDEDEGYDSLVDEVSDSDEEIVNEAEDTEDEDEEDLYNFDVEYSIDEDEEEDDSDSESLVEETPVTSIINPTKSLTINETDIPFGEDPNDDLLTSMDYDIINMQQGASDNRYNIRCYSFFMDSEYHWINTMDLSDLICTTLGFPEERLPAFFESIYNSLIREKDARDLKLFDQFCDNVELSEGEISESLDYLIENVLDPEEDEDDGLQQMLAFSQNMDKQRDLNIDPQDLPKFKMTIKGKGKKRKLIFDENKFDEYTRNLLQEKYKLRITKKAEKRTDKQFFISKENEVSDNILVKYPYGMHVLSIREEIENFANDNTKWLVGSKRSFPPFDPHGNKVVIKFGKHFNLNHKKLVSKQRHYIQLVKTKNTIKKSQNLVHVDLLCRQRPVFMRKDVKMPSDIAMKFNDENGESVKKNGTSKLADGAVVAAGARELTGDNLGFKLLAKMGWSSGMSLGPDSNEGEGIKEPIVAIIKKGRKGLGHNTTGT